MTIWGVPATTIWAAVVALSGLETTSMLSRSLSSAVRSSPSPVVMSRLAPSVFFSAVNSSDASTLLTSAVEPLIWTRLSDRLVSVAAPNWVTVTMPLLGVRVTVSVPLSVSATLMPKISLDTPATTVGRAGSVFSGVDRIEIASLVAASVVVGSPSDTATSMAPVALPADPVKRRVASVALTSATLPVDFSKARYRRPKRWPVRSATPSR